MKIETSIDTPKMARAEAFALVKDLLTETPSFTAGISPRQAGELLRFFAPAIPKKPQTALDWVRGAVAKKDIRYYLNYIYVTEEDIVATNGAMLRVTPNKNGMPPGFYDPLTMQKCTLDAATRYPDCWKTLSNGYDVRKDLSFLKKAEIIQFEYRGKVIEAYKWDGGGVDRQLLDSTLAAPGCTLQMNDKISNGGIRVESDWGTAVVMPMRI